MCSVRCREPLDRSGAERPPHQVHDVRSEHRPQIVIPGNSEAPLVSIGVPTYERAATLERAVQSALAQTHDRLEVVISDNGSGDRTEELCRELAARDPRVRYLRHERNLGSTANFNHLFEVCSGEYV